MFSCRIYICAAEVEDQPSRHVLESVSGDSDVGGVGLHEIDEQRRGGLPVGPREGAPSAAVNGTFIILCSLLP